MGPPPPWLIIFNIYFSLLVASSFTCTPVDGENLAAQGLGFNRLQQVTRQTSVITP
jgi:hypothetical protein